MPATYYGEAIYGTPAYGRIAAGLAAAQMASVRSTGLQVSIIDERVNRWESFVSENLSSGDHSKFKALGNVSWQQDYAFYRTQSDAIELDNGNVYRVRVGNGGTTDFNIYDQTVTDLTNPTQWTTWNLLYSGTHYAVAVAKNGNTPIVYTSKSNGLYRNNVLKWSKPNIIFIRPIQGMFDALFITVVRRDNYEPVYRVMDTWYTENIQSVTPYADDSNYRWYDVELDAILQPDGRVIRYQTMPRYDPRSHNNGDSISVIIMQSVTITWYNTAPRLIRGLAGEVGHNLIRSPRITGPLTDGFYYLFYTEGHRDDDYEITESPGQSVVWQRSKDGIHWSEPVVAGTPLGPLVESGAWVFIIGYESVYRRPSTHMVYDITNYVPKVDFDIPRDNQSASGTMTIANPNGINDQLVNLADRRIKIQPGLRTSDGTYEFTEFDDWWIKRCVQNVEGASNRLTLEFGDIWERLSSQLRDTFNFVGQLKWRDWHSGSGHRNQAFNYYFVSDTSPVVNATDHTLTTRGICLYTGWKGQNARVKVHFSGVTGNPSIIFRYVDAKNYQRFEKQGTHMVLIDRVNGVETTVDDVDLLDADTSPVLELYFTWYQWTVSVNGVATSGAYDDQPNVKPGYVGFKGTKYTVTSFELDDYEPTLTTEELVKTALAMGDYHDVSTGDSSSEQLAIIWGPQTDIPTPADGLRQALEAMKWELVWIDGRIRVGSFKDPTVTRILEDSIVKTDYVDEANRRINQAAVDGNDDPWLETDVADTQARDRQIVAYYDLPELTSQDDVIARAQEEIRRGQLGRTPGGQVPLFYDLRRMDVVTWIDNVGKANNVRIEGISVTINQDEHPSQRETLDTSLVASL